MIYRQISSPLHAVRPAVGCLYCLALGTVAALYEHPLLNAVVLLLVVAVAYLSGCGPRLLKTLLYVLPFALLIALINPIISREGLTVILRTVPVPLLSPGKEMEITLEATVYGLVQGLRALVLVAVAGLYSMAVNPDSVLRMLRRLSLRSALTATIATRVVPTLIADAQRMRLAQRTVVNSAQRGGRVQLFGAIFANALDRSLDTAAALELRGYGSSKANHRNLRKPWSTQDIAFTVAACVILLTAVSGFITDCFGFQPYPLVAVQLSGTTAICLLLLALAALLPNTVRRGLV